MSQPLPQVQLTTEDGQTFLLYGRAADMALMLAEAQSVLQASDKGKAAFHWAGREVVFEPTPRYHRKRKVA